MNNSEVSKQFLEKEEALSKEIRRLASEVDAEYVFQTLAFRQICNVYSNYSEAKHDSIPAILELAAFYLYPFFGQNTNWYPEQVEEIIKDIVELNGIRSGPIAFDEKYNDTERHLQLYSEIVRGDSYPSQTRKIIEGILVPHDDWFKTKIDIGPKRALEIIDAYLKARNSNDEKQRETYIFLHEHLYF